MTMETDPMSADPLTALSNEYGEGWKVWRPGRYIADHRRLDVTLIADSVPGLADKLRTFTELVKDLNTSVPGCLVRADDGAGRQDEAEVPRDDRHIRQARDWQNRRSSPLRPYNSS